jgi:hypothetical protein
MSGLRRGLLIAAGLLLALLVALAVTLALLLRPVSLKGRIEREVQARSGLVMHIDGEVQWRLWPEPALSVGATRLEESGAAAPLARWQALALEAQWAALLHGDARLAHLALDGVTVTLVRGADGAIHWPKLEGAPAAKPAGAAAKSSQAIAIEQVEVKHAVVRVVDAGAPQATAGSLDDFVLQFGVVYDPAAGTLTLAQPAARAIAHGGTLQPDGVRIVFDAPALLLHTRPLRLETPQLHLWVNKMEAMLHFDGPVDLAPPAGSGQLTLVTPSLRGLSVALGAELPPTRDPKVFGPLVVQANWHVDADNARLEPLSIDLDDGEYKGSASMPVAGPAAGHPVRFALKGGKLDLRRYLRPKDQPGEPFKLPVEWLRAQHVEGVLELEEANAVAGVLHGVKIRVIDQGSGRAK